MESTLKYALDAAKEITIAKVSNSNVTATKDGGKNVSEFYQEVFDKILDLSRERKD